MATGVDATKSPARPSHEAIENKGGNANDVAGTPEERIDRDAMTMAKRAENRIHDNEGKNPGTQVFTK